MIYNVWFETGVWHLQSRLDLLELDKPCEAGAVLNSKMTADTLLQ